MGCSSHGGEGGERRKYPCFPMGLPTAIANMLYFRARHGIEPVMVMFPMSLHACFDGFYDTQAHGIESEMVKLVGVGLLVGGHDLTLENLLYLGKINELKFAFFLRKLFPQDSRVYCLGAAFCFLVPAQISKNYLDI